VADPRCRPGCSEPTVACHGRRERQAESADCSSEWEVWKALPIVHLLSKYGQNLPGDGMPCVCGKKCGASPNRVGSDPQSERAAPLRIEVPFGIVGERDVKCDVLVEFSTSNPVPLTGTRLNGISCSRNPYRGRHSFLSRHIRRSIKTFEHTSSLVTTRPHFSQPNLGQNQELRTVCSVQPVAGLGFRELTIRCTKLSGDRALIGNSGECLRPLAIYWPRN
jgi:hypothetical protein